MGAYHFLNFNFYLVVCFEMYLILTNLFVIVLKFAQKILQANGVQLDDPKSFSTPVN